MKNQQNQRVLKQRKNRIMQAPRKRKSSRSLTKYFHARGAKAWIPNFVTLTITMSTNRAISAKPVRDIGLLVVP